ncbi:putative serine/threonine-protein kinase IKS1 [Nakaseomyces glabratus]|uniref:Putative serine/threonine-protein kinase IKS1 n=1 Tax=Candida glabrata TaxID=5478 RepID=A0A0W0E8P8_CANGB|nr:Serine/Threonine protein kinases active-site signature [Nakaseomyces glabratus]KTA97239.1 putative serine/threonine-protein kinase IKS1 [Nakaseomyces glabratus]KTA98245.1 putative serine/threonine-protein kinase IKS1 [Nakaseomyces glabratus]KTB06078.1 putative serine/threonine-protein kinase IKS1 [Nakaseomyces glabratus]KTB11111.1 putative serine/threonine-protein kinase IKS1 [Nakaseomyces glabratus]
MSLVPYKEGSIILNDPSSRSLAIVDPKIGSVAIYKQINARVEHLRSDRRSSVESIASYMCPHCGTEVHLSNDEGYGSSARKARKENTNRRTVSPDFDPDDLSNYNMLSTTTGSSAYFRLLQRNHQFYAIQDGEQTENSHIPDDMFIPGYFHKFFDILEPLGNGARGSVYKVVHKLGSTPLGTYALKKIPIGNDDEWFKKCIREVKILSSLKHTSENLITYNHVWMEMDASVGHVQSLDGSSTGMVGDVPCMFILQQYCAGGNLEDCINNVVFEKNPELISIEERKKRFRERHGQKSSGSAKAGLSTLQILSILHDIASGLKELHNSGLIHRDLKPSNCLLLSPYKHNDEEKVFPTVVIGDFGESQMKGEYRTATGCTGTMEFTAPELIIENCDSNSNSQYHEFSFQSDMYSLGMIGYFVIFGELPFGSELDIPEIKNCIKALNIDKTYMVKKHREMRLKDIDYRIFDVLQLLLSSKESIRPSAIEVESIFEKLIGLNIKHDDNEKLAYDYSSKDKLEKSDVLYEQPDGINIGKLEEFQSSDKGSASTNEAYFQIASLPATPRLALPNLIDRQQVSDSTKINLTNITLRGLIFVFAALAYYRYALTVNAINPQVMHSFFWSSTFMALSFVDNQRFLFCIFIIQFIISLRAMFLY